MTTPDRRPRPVRDGEPGRPEVVARVGTDRGELVLRRHGRHYEIISNGVFLMDTRDGRSERLLVDAAVDAHVNADRVRPGHGLPAPVRSGHPAAGLRVLIGGLGVGFSLRAALARAQVAAVTVIEVEETIVTWYREYLCRYPPHPLDDPRVTLIRADLVSWLDGPGPGRTAARFDVICLDVDNGPHWTVSERNRLLYGMSGLDLLASRLDGGGVLAVWSAHRDQAYEHRLRARFPVVEVHQVPVARGDPDVVYLAYR